MSARDYPVTFPYGAKDGYWYGPNGKAGAYHRGDDRAMPSGTPVIVNGTVIGLSGNTGMSGGPHLHLGKYVNGADVNPNEQGFDLVNPKVIATGYDQYNGNYVKLQDASAVWVYLHLSKINVSVGQVLQGDDMIPDHDNWYWRFNKLMLQIRGREISREEFRKNFVGQPTFKMVEVLSDDQEADRALQAQTVGQVAMRDKWDQQIYALQAAVNDLSTRPSKVEYAKALADAADIAAKLADSQKALETERRNIKEKIVLTHDEETKANVNKILSLVTTIFEYFAGQYKTFSKYIKK